MLQYLGLDPLLTQDQHYTLLKDTFSLTHMVHRCRLLAAIYKAMRATSRFLATLCLHFLCKILGKFLLIWVSVVITRKMLVIAVSWVHPGNRERKHSLMNATTPSAGGEEWCPAPEHYCRPPG